MQARVYFSDWDMNGHWYKLDWAAFKKTVETHGIDKVKGLGWFCEQVGES